MGILIGSSGNKVNEIDEEGAYRELDEVDWIFLGVLEEEAERAVNVVDERKMIKAR